ncbi:hypothetical protein [Streptomyces sp. NBC_01190]|uniref:hypothetical protein n=1 Tax=Streptomyces sp. NBC_01190 TaxID=2903767 RepID=UPI00386F573E|nr:hypothetical protein OG519_12670 [Streptomyces sp. NBC_01190]
MIRNTLGSLLALAGAVVVVQSPFHPWYGGRHGTGIRVDDLFTSVGATPHDAAPLGSLFLPMGFAALLSALGALMRSWLVETAAGLLVLGVTVLWMVRQAQFAGSLTAGGDGMDTGVAFATGGALSFFLAGWLFHGRRKRRRRARQPRDASYEPPPAEPYPSWPADSYAPLPAPEPLPQPVGAYEPPPPYEPPVLGPDDPDDPDDPDSAPTLVGLPLIFGEPTTQGGTPAPAPPHDPGAPPPEAHGAVEKP